MFLNSQAFQAYFVHYTTQVLTKTKLLVLVECITKKIQFFTQVSVCIVVCASFLVEKRKSELKAVSNIFRLKSYLLCILLKNKQNICEHKLIFLFFRKAEITKNT